MRLDINRKVTVGDKHHDKRRYSFHYSTRDEKHVNGHVLLLDYAFNATLLFNSQCFSHTDSATVSNVNM